MKRLWLLAPLGWALACVDLFHDTDDLVCVSCTDADVEGTTDADATADAASDRDEPIAPLCAASSTQAREWATAACVWLGAVGRPFSTNEPGECMFQALRAYDCTLDPAMEPRGKRAAFWRCIHAATSGGGDHRAAVTACIFPDGPPGCESRGAELWGCDANQSSAVLCGAGVPAQIRGGANCAAMGGACDPLRREPCTALPESGSATCVSSRCDGDVAIVCANEREVQRYDCTQSGAGTCASTRCAPLGDDSCTTSGAVQCEDDIASSCVGGTQQKSRCTVAGLACAEGSLGSSLDQACVATDTPCATGSSTCSGDKTEVVACMRGQEVRLRCDLYGLPPCRVETNVAGDGAQGASCSP